MTIDVMQLYASHVRLVSATHIPTRGAGRFVSRADATCCATAFKSSAWTAAKIRSVRYGCHDLGASGFGEATKQLDTSKADNLSPHILPRTYLFVLLQQLLQFVRRLVDGFSLCFCNHGIRLFVFPCSALQLLITTHATGSVNRPSMHNSSTPLVHKKAITLNRRFVATRY